MKSIFVNKDKDVLHKWIAEPQVFMSSFAAQVATFSM
jgi:hypothetical protein